MKRTLLLLPLTFFCIAASIPGQERGFAGALGGISTLSADGRSLITANSADVSLYKPENGATFQMLGGLHFNDYLSVQVNYGWNRNSLTLTSSTSSSGTPGFYEQSRCASQHTTMGELLLYFRNLKSRFRPYLSVGGGIVRLISSDSGITRTIGNAAAPGAFDSTRPALRVAVGIDVALAEGWAFRFTFSETIRDNAVSALLTPPGRRNLANFQNLFGFVKHF